MFVVYTSLERNNRANGIRSISSSAPNSMSLPVNAEGHSSPDPACDLSLIIPTFNRRDLTLRAVASVLAQQTSWQVEIIVVIDGSTDDTEAALRERYAGDARVKVIVAARGGASAARNVGSRAARGRLVCFLDSDDYWQAGTLAIFERAFARWPELAFVSIDGSTIPDADGQQIARLVAGDSPGWTHRRFREVRLASETLDVNGAASIAALVGDFFPAIINGDLFYLSGMLMRREASEAAGPFTERFRYFNDWEFFARLCLQGPGAYLNHDGFRRDTGRPDQISRRRPPTSMPRRHVYILRSLPRRFAARAARYVAPLRDALDDAHYMLGRSLAQSAQRRRARRYLLRCLRRGFKPARSLVLLSTTFF